MQIFLKKTFSYRNYEKYFFDKRKMQKKKKIVKDIAVKVDI